MPGWLYYLLATSGLLLIFGLELRSKSFRQGVFSRKNPARVKRNWAFLATALFVGAMLEELMDVVTAILPPLFVWKEHVLLNVAGCFLVAELFGWFSHFVKHKVSWLWKFHFQHHREKHFDIWLTTHTHSLEVLCSGILSGLILTTLGFSTLSMQIYLLFYSLANTYQHSTFSYSLGFLDKLIVSPAYHRVHHAVGSSINFGDTLTIWDLVFRTAQWPKAADFHDLEVGLEEGAPEPYGFAAEMTYFLRREPEKRSEKQELPELGYQKA